MPIGAPCIPHPAANFLLRFDASKVAEDGSTVAPTIEVAAALDSTPLPAIIMRPHTKPYDRSHKASDIMSWKGELYAQQVCVLSKVGVTCVGERSPPPTHTHTHTTHTTAFKTLV